MKRKIMIVTFALFIFLSLTACLKDKGSIGNENINNTAVVSQKTTDEVGKENKKVQKPIKSSIATLINEEGNTVMERIMVPEGFEREVVDEGSFGEYLRALPLKPHGTKAKYFDGKTKSRDVYEAVINMDIGNRDLQQCADAVMRLRAEYLYGRGHFDKIHFNFTNGFKADYATWRKGNVIKVEGNKVFWVAQKGTFDDYNSFRKYLDMVFAYSGTLSLSQEMKAVPLNEMEIGDVFLKGGSPGHCVIVLDMAENKKTGEKVFIVAQSYMPAQDIHILKNTVNDEGNPWYPFDFGDELNTPEWTFTKDQLFRFDNT